MSQAQLPPADELDHVVCESLLPAYLHGHLDKAQSQAVGLHVARCSQCQRALQLANQLRTQLAAESVALGAGLQQERADANFERLWSRLETEGTQQAPALSPGMFVRPGWRIAALLGVTVLAVLLWRSPFLGTGGAEYQTLADSAVVTTGDRIRILFADDLSQSALQQLLADANSEIVAGPSARGVFTLQAQNVEQAMTRLRQHPKVILAEVSSY